MVDALRKLDRKFLIFVLIIFLLPIFIILLLVVLRSCNTKITYEKYETRMEDAALKYLEDYKGVPTSNQEFVEVSLSTLIDKGYISSTQKLLGDKTCTGSVSARRSGVEQDEDKKGYLNVLANLKCDKYSTSTLYTALLKNEVTTGPGLYKVGDSYLFKGDTVRNYVKFNKGLYVVLGIDENGIARLVNTEPENAKAIWDIKYNSEVKSSSGKNIYADSNILKTLNKLYRNDKKFKADVRKKLVSYDACIGKREKTDRTISTSLDCSEVLPGQVMFLLNVSDYANASLDPECDSVRSPSCSNYNYLRRLHLETWTLNTVENNSYEVYYLSNSVIGRQKAGSYLNYNVVIMLDGNEKIASGKGTSTDPYVIR